jgi:hypothetical protein
MNVNAPKRRCEIAVGIKIALIGLLNELSEFVTNLYAVFTNVVVGVFLIRVFTKRFFETKTFEV